MTRVVVHAGFHKTGTTTIQSCLQSNHKVLAPQVRILRKTHIEAAAARAIWVARFPNRLTRSLFRRALIRQFRAAKIAECEQLVISAERLCGVVPGRSRIWSYDAAPLLAEEVVCALRAVLGPDTEITFLYTIRDRGRWAESAWRHVVKSRRFARDLDSYKAAIEAVPDLEEQARRVEARIAPVPVRTAPLEVYGERPLGPAEAVFELLDLPARKRRRLRPGPVENIGISRTEAEKRLRGGRPAR